MGKVIFEFDSVEEASEIQDVINGWRWKNVMWDLEQNLRNTTHEEYEITEKYL